MKKIGIASSISALYDYDIFDTLDFLGKHKQFNAVQLYLNEDLFCSSANFKKLAGILRKFEQISVYFHLSGELNFNFFDNTDYIDNLIILNNTIKNEGFIIHFDHEPEIMEYRNILSLFNDNQLLPLRVELFFKTHNEIEYKQQLNKYQSLFSLYYKQFNIQPVIDIPRYFHINNAITIEKAVNDIKLTFNLMKDLNLPIILHLIDICDVKQERSDFCTIGTGIIPYTEIFEYIKYNQINIENTILEYEDKIKPLESVDFLESM